MHYRIGILQIDIISMHNCMDRRSINFDWNRARAFLVTTEIYTHVLSRGAKGITSPQPSLERCLGAGFHWLGEGFKFFAISATRLPR